MNLYKLKHIKSKKYHAIKQIKTEKTITRNKETQITGQHESL